MADSELNNLSLVFWLGDRKIMEFSRPPLRYEHLYISLKESEDYISESRYLILYVDEDSENVKVDCENDYENALDYARIERWTTMNFFLFEKQKKDTSGFSTVLTPSIHLQNQMDQRDSRMGQDGTQWLDGRPYQEEGTIE